MASWHRVCRLDVSLRVAGAMLCVVAYGAIARLVALDVPPRAAGLSACALAATGFLAASLGSMLATLGCHVFDHIELSGRWRPRDCDTRHARSEVMMAMNRQEPGVLVIGRDADGSWSVRERAGMLLGRFRSAEAAQRFAEAERDSHAGGATQRIEGLRIEGLRIEGRLTLRGGTVDA